MRNILVVSTATLPGWALTFHIKSRKCRKRNGVGFRGLQHSVLPFPSALAAWIKGTTHPEYLSRLSPKPCSHKTILSFCTHTQTWLTTTFSQNIQALLCALHRILSLAVINSLHLEKDCIFLSSWALNYAINMLICGFLFYILMLISPRWSLSVLQKCEFCLNFTPGCQSENQVPLQQGTLTLGRFQEQNLAHQESSNWASLIPPPDISSFVCPSSLSLEGDWGRTTQTLQLL